MDTPNLYDDYQHAGLLHRTEEAGSRSPVSGFSSFTFLCVVVVLVGLGLISMFSASYDEALKLGLQSTYFFLRQIAFAAMGFAAFIMIQYVPMRWIRILIPVLLLVAIALMLLTLLTPLGSTRLGARRWIALGPLPSFQPSELLKIAVVLFLAAFFSNADSKRLSLKQIIIPAAVLLGSAFLIVAQKDYSTMLVFLGVGFSLLLVAGLPVSWLLLFLTGVAGPAVVFLLIEPYRIRRLVSFLFPTIDPTGLNWQVSNSIKAISAGGLWGRGLGKGFYKLGSIPEVQSDFIFANIAEEMGLLGVMALFVLFFIFAFIGFCTYLKFRIENRFNALAAFGITSLIVWQALVNIAVVTGMLPPTGITLPFFSQGGTSLFVVIGESGLLYKIMQDSRERKMRMVVDHG
jgi:cell division protein FtsW